MTEVQLFVPLRGPCHYIMVTRAGLDAGVVLQWRRTDDGWRPRLLFIDRVISFDGNRLNGYRQVLFSAMHPDAFLALCGAGVRVRSRRERSGGGP